MFFPESPLLYKSEPEKSLAQMYEKLSSSVMAVLNRCGVSVNQFRIYI